MKTALFLRLSLLVVVAVLGLPTVCDASDKTYNDCLKQAANSKGARRAENAGGKIGFHEYLIEYCGFRPVTKTKSGLVKLRKSDCTMLYGWAVDGVCTEDQFANYEHEIVKQLNPEVFQIDTYSNACQKMNEDDKKITLKEFEKLVCEQSIDDDGQK
jgi:hypothetical protein